MTLLASSQANIGVRLGVAFFFFEFIDVPLGYVTLCRTELG